MSIHDIPARSGGLVRTAAWIAVLAASGPAACTGPGRVWSERDRVLIYAATLAAVGARVGADTLLVDPRPVRIIEPWEPASRPSDLTGGIARTPGAVACRPGADGRCGRSGTRGVATLSEIHRIGPRDAEVVVQYVEPGVAVRRFRVGVRYGNGSWRARAQ